MYYLMQLLSRTLGLLSPKSLERLAATLTFIVFDLLRLRRQLMLQNLERAFGTTRTVAEKETIARAAVFNFVQTLLETLSSPAYPLAQNIELRGSEHLYAALAKGQGVYVLCFHMGNWEAMAAKVSQEFVPVYAVMKPIGSAGMNRFVEELRTRNGLNWIKRDKKGDGFRGIREVLQRKDIVGFIIDQARPGEPRLPFFGHPAKTNTSFAAIWRRMPAPIVPVHIHRVSFGRHVVTCEPELTMVHQRGNVSGDILQNSQMFSEVVENIVRQYPEHYFWFHNRWK
ncbi:lysophospholipid acyltransferase family protein [Oligoflexus tunisiensis]|uniref:lysophospholipid acyltransferase family protein n=1 Tax=Oligoflexus tunisiensis TaxID=708132 RepID=UPI00159F2D47|nr:lysophospholipid acyltransferase family protein [Oligoflexus tunisiensis]